MTALLEAWTAREAAGLIYRPLAFLIARGTGAIALNAPRYSSDGAVDHGKALVPQVWVCVSAGARA